MVCKDDLLLLLSDIESQLDELEEKISVKVSEETHALVNERKLKLAKAEKKYTKTETRVLLKMSLYGETSLEKAMNNLELSYKTT
ncbi:hypothetical protein FZC84_20815 [Rossellomorea vietnamensis]|uniref:Uncharacterized protein n=1 Tax=Rossellomorea vietnamensis TaxID=218284 RepID=A0A5D4M446_9BACI|nr:MULTISPECIES: DUF5446 family protein [Bacillaceae]TYR96093.1 hypothetical protein FZC84_20815 [Rossellomorea vietnamensis]